MLADMSTNTMNTCLIDLLLRADLCISYYWYFCEHKWWQIYMKLTWCRVDDIPWNISVQGANHYDFKTIKLCHKLIFCKQLQEMKIPCCNINTTNLNAFSIFSCSLHNEIRWNFDRCWCTLWMQDICKCLLSKTCKVSTCRYCTCTRVCMQSYPSTKADVYKVWQHQCYHFHIQYWMVREPSFLSRHKPNSPHHK